MNKKYLLSSVTASIAFLYANQGTAQCVSTQDCTALGYTESSCPNSGIKCPFGNKWFCGGDSTAICKQEGFSNTCSGDGQSGKGESCANLYKQCNCHDTYKYTCSGIGYYGGVGSSCNGKYKSCICTEGYNWYPEAEACKASCEIGTLYYSDGTCSDVLENGKTLLGVVIYSNGASGGGWIMTVKPVSSPLWGSGDGGDTDIPGVINITSREFNDVQASCIYTDAITAYCNSSECPAAWAAKNYKPIGTPNGKTWCLPSAGLLYDNRTRDDWKKIILGIITAGGDTSDSIWTSTEYSYTLVWYFSFSESGFSTYATGKDINESDGYDYYSVRPVMEF